MAGRVEVCGGVAGSVSPVEPGEEGAGVVLAEGEGKWGFI